MTVRPFDWRDLPVLHRYRNQGLFLDSALVLTRGTMLIPAGALLSVLAPATGIFTYLCDHNQAQSQPFLGQVMHTTGQPFARLSFVAPLDRLESPEFTALLEALTVQIGERGALHLLAEVDDDREAFVSLHERGFAIYARQRVWKLKEKKEQEPRPGAWQVCTERDVFGIRVLYGNLVPGLVQQMEPPPAQKLHGLVYYQAGELKAYVELKYGPYGIWAQPFVHPDAEEVADRLVYLLQDLPYRRNRPVYLCVRSYQSWLEGMIEAIGADPGSRQAVMVRHLAAARRAVKPYALPAMNGTHPEPTAPIAHVENKPETL